MNAQQKDQALAIQIAERLNQGATANGWHPLGAKLEKAARTLRRAQLTLHRWAEEECNGTIQREEGDGKPFRVWDSVGQRADGSWYDKKSQTPIPDRERGALARVERVCKEFGLYHYHQTDPRGCALYVSAEPLMGQNYSSKGIACL